VKTLTIVASLVAVVAASLLAGSASANPIKPGTSLCKRGIVYVCQ